MSFFQAKGPRGMVLGFVVGAAALACLAIVFYEVYVPGRVSEVTGSVVTREVIADDDARPRHFVYVRLDGGQTIRARTDRFVTTMPGERVTLVEIETPLLGLHRYRYKRHVEPGRPGAAVERVTR